MIKAEIIEHEGNPGPNWLDRCRTAVTPGKVSGMVLIALLIGGGAFVLARSDSSEQSTTTTNQTTPSSTDSSGLQVAPLAQPTVQAEAGLPTLQPANGGNTDTDNTQDDAASSLEAPVTPNLNTDEKTTKSTDSSKKDSKKSKKVAAKKKKSGKKDR